MVLQPQNTVSRIFRVAKPIRLAFDLFPALCDSRNPATVYLTSMLALAATLAIQALVAMALLSPPVLAPLAAPAIGVAASDTGIFTAFVYAGACFASLTSGVALRRFGAMRLSQ